MQKLKKQDSILIKSKDNKDKIQHCTQNINVTIKIDQKENTVAGCFKAIAGIFKKRP